MTPQEFKALLLLSIPEERLLGVRLGKHGSFRVDLNTQGLNTEEALFLVAEGLNGSSKITGTLDWAAQNEETLTFQFSYLIIPSGLRDN